MTTLKKVAEQAGVSFKTVSRVVNGDPNVAADTRERVLQAIDSLNYRPNLAARQMRTRRTHSIGLIADAVATTPYAVQIIKGALDAAWEHQHMLLIVDADGNPQREAEAVETLLERSVDGMIYATMFHRVVQPPAAAAEIPTVLANCRSADDSLPSFVPDEVGAGYTATETLIRAGHRRIGFLNLEPEVVASQGRLAGYQRALAAHEIAYDPTLVIHGWGRPDAGYAGVQRLLMGDRPGWPTALFCGNDQVAQGAYQALNEMGLRIPADMAVIGFDNLELVAAYLQPGLSTMALPHYEIGWQAVDYLLSGGQEGGQRLLPCPYVARGSIT